MTSTSVQPAGLATRPSSSTSRKTGLAILGMAALLGIFVARLDAPAASRAEQTSAGEFSVARALKHVEAISRAPHPVGSAEHARVQQYIVQTLTEVGLSPQIQRATGANRKVGVAATVENIVAGVKGSEGGKSILLVAHYDSVATGPGASDDAAAVAALLEAARISQSLPQPKRDIQFLFTDGEELGLLGAHAFVSENPAARNVGVVLNFEARGNSGPVILFETSDQNGWLVQNFSKAVSNPVANSLSYEIYKRLPNDTDFTVFKRAGYAGLNFAFIDGLAHYHTATDTVQNLDRGSLQQQGDYAVKLAQWFGNLPQLDSRQGRTTYFDIAGRALVQYSSTVAVILIIVAALLLALGLFRGFHQKYVSIKALGLGIAVMAAAVLVSIAGTMLMQQITVMLEARSAHVRAGTLYHSGFYVAAFVMLGLAAAAAFYSWGVKRVGTHNVAAAGLLVWMALAMGVNLLMPGAGYLFTWPVLFNTIAWLVILYTGGRPGVRAVASGIAVMATVILLAPIAHKIFTAFAIGSGTILSALCALFLGLCVYHLGPEAVRRSWILPTSLLGLGTALFVASLVWWNFDSNNPKFDSMIYGAETDAHKNVFASYDNQMDEWTAKFLTGPGETKTLPEFLPWSSRKIMQTPASGSLVLRPPELKLLENKTIAGGRELHVQIKSSRQAPVLSVFVSQSEPVLKAIVNGKEMSPMRPGAGSWSMQYYGAPPEGIDLVLDVQASGVIHIQVEDASYGLPEEIVARYGSRPRNIIPAPARFNDCTLAAKTFSL